LTIIGQRVLPQRSFVPLHKIQRASLFELGVLAVESFGIRPFLIALIILGDCFVKTPSIGLPRI